MPANGTPAPAAAPTGSPSKAVVFFRRLASTVLLWSIVLWTIFSENHSVTNWVFLAIMLGLAWQGLREFYNLVEARGLVCFRQWGIASGLALMLVTFLYFTGVIPHAHERLPAKANDFETTLIIVFVLGLCLRRFVAKDVKDGLLAISTTLFGLLYVPWLLNFISKIAFFPGVEGRYYILYFILVTKLSDVGAYVTGSLIGRHKMIPRISPGKTWEGFGGAIAFSTLASVLFAKGLGHHLAGMNTLHAVILGVLLSASAVIGDLIESLFKREAGVKDSGKLLPGIGGILDLLDSLLFNAPLMYLYLRHILTATPTV
ncbi:MAG: phosphatidate cytidylyltransferase [Verrucomicrobiales bacterium]|nr:phosphatidate cytidylyltransferase [Verrucomicrobiales bacterium]